MPNEWPGLRHSAGEAHVDRTTPTIIIVSIIVLAVAGMYFGWRARVRKNADLAVPDSVPDSGGEEIAVGFGLYVATTLAAQPFERVASHGLGFRARTSVIIRDDGVAIEPTGRAPFFIPLAAILAVERATWAIDKAVEPGGLVVITWRLGEIELDSYFRMDDGPEVLLSAGTDLIEGLA